MPRKPRVRAEAPPPSDRTETTSITISERHHDALQAVALARQIPGSGRKASISAVLGEIIEKHIRALEREGAKFLAAIKARRG